jgi:hypothetical protein
MNLTQDLIEVDQARSYKYPFENIFTRNMKKNEKSSLHEESFRIWNHFVSPYMAHIVPVSLMLVILGTFSPQLV